MADYFYYPDEVRNPRTFILDWNVASRLVNLYRGTRFEKDEATRARLLDLESRFPRNGVAIAGFGASEPEWHPGFKEFDADRLRTRSAEAVAMLEQGNGRFADFFDGSPAADVIIPKPHRLNRPDPVKLGEHFVFPSFLVLLKAYLLKAQGVTGAEGVSQFLFWLNHDLRYRPSREMWLGLIMLAGTRQASAKVEKLLKVNRAKGNADDLTKRIRGAAWDVFYTRLIAFMHDKELLPEAPQPVVLVTEDATMAEVLGVIEFVDMVDTSSGSLGRDWMPTEVFDEAHVALVVDEIRKANERTHHRNQNSESVIREVMRRARVQSRQLAGELARLQRTR